MKFKAKLSKQGNGYCIYIPVDVRTKLVIENEYEWEVCPEISLEVEKTEPLIKKYSYEWCNTHNGYKGACGCN